jgi:dynein heavy chain
MRLFSFHRDRHWQQISEELGVPIVIDNSFTVTKAVSMGLPEHLPVISKVADVAGKEFAIEMALDKMQNEWKSIELQVRTRGIRWQGGRCKPAVARTAQFG